MALNQLHLSSSEIVVMLESKMESLTIKWPKTRVNGEKLFNVAL